MNLVVTLLDAGLTLATDGDRLLVSPRENITPPLRDVIKENRAALHAYVRQTERLALDFVSAIHRACIPSDEATRLASSRECRTLRRDGQQGCAGASKGRRRCGLA
jgi:hypothetical protein